MYQDLLLEGVVVVVVAVVDSVVDTPLLLTMVTQLVMVIVDGKNMGCLVAEEHNTDDLFLSLGDEDAVCITLLIRIGSHTNTHKHKTHSPRLNKDEGYGLATTGGFLFFSLFVSLSPFFF
jgi:hypothetical protein